MSPAASLTPIPPSQGPGLQHIALHALETVLRDGDFYAETPEKSRLFTEDQMMGLIAAVGARTARPDRSAFWEDRARSLWEKSESAFVEGTFYAGTLPAPSGVVCLDLLANTWALRAAHALSNAGISATPDPAKRVEHLRTLLGAFLTGTSSAGKPLCPADSPSVPLHQRPPLYLALLETRSASPSGDSELVGSLKNTIDGFFDGGFAPADDLFLVAVNAQMLDVLVLAAQMFPAEKSFVETRDELAAWLQKEAIVFGPNGMEARNVVRGDRGLEAQPGVSPDGQIWLAHALSGLKATQPTSVNQGLVESLLASYPELFWNAEAGGFLAGEGTFVYADYNLLPAILSRAPTISLNALDPSVFAFVVPARASFTYPEPTAPGGGQLYILNEWIARFTMAADASGPVTAIVPAAELGPFNLSAPTSAFFPAPRLLRSAGTGAGEITLMPVADDPGLLRFSPGGTDGQNSFRLDAYVPARPVFSDFGSTIRVVFESYFDGPLTVGTLQLELDATLIRIRTATLDNSALAAFEVVDPVITEQVPEPHMRVLLSDVTLPPGRSELVLGYSDITRPEVGTPSITRDLEGREVIKNGDGEPIQVLQGETAFVRATVRDNAALRSVQLRYRTLDQSVDLRMSPVEGQTDVYAVQLPTRGIPTGEGIIQVVAIDAAGTGNLNESAPVKIDVRDPLFAGNIVLFVFGGTLFVTSFIIWLKVRRKELH